MGRTLPDDTQAAILLSLFDPPTIRKLRARATETRKELADLSFAEVKDLLTKVLKNPKPICSERFATFTLRQSPQYSIDDWAAKVLEQTHKFEFQDFTLDDLQTLIYVIGLNNDTLRKELFKKMNSLEAMTPPSKLTFTMAHKAAKDHLALELMCQTIRPMARTLENTGIIHKVEKSLVTDSETSGEENTDSVNTTEQPVIHKIQSSSSRPHYTSQQKNNRTEYVVREKKPPSSCWHCGQMHFNKDCPHKEKTCNKCLKVGHLASVCRRTKGSAQSHAVHAVSGHKRAKRKYINVGLNQTITKLQLDTASDVSILSTTLWKKIGSPQIQPTTFSAKHAGAGPVTFLGECEIEVSYKKEKVRNWKIYVVNNPNLNVFGLDLIDKFDLGHKSLNAICQQIISTEDAPQVDERRKQLEAQFPKVFQPGLGTCKFMKGKLQLKKGTLPVFRAKRQIPYAVQDAVDKEIDRLLAEGVIRSTNYSQWAAPVVVVKKPNGTIRLCADFSTGLNDALEPHQYPLPSMEGIFASLNGGTIFSQLDLSDAYLQIEVEEESKELLTIHTHRGLFQYNRLPFGVKVAPGMFQQIMDQLLAGIDGVIAYLDDIIIVGKSETDHQEKLDAVLQRINDWGLRLRPDKCALHMSEIKFLGTVVNKDGISTDPTKVNAIDQMTTPTDISSLRSFLGFVNYYGKFVKNLHSLKRPLEELLCNKKNWNWTDACEKAFHKIKEIIKSPLLLTHFDPRFEMIVAADASSTGVGAVLLHRYPDGSQKAIAHASKSLTNTQRNYGQIEKEAYALVFAVERFHKFLWGHTFSLWTDHKPLLAIFGAKNGIPVTTANRLQRWALKLLGYDFTIEHKSTTDFGEADALSRLISQQTTPEDTYVIAAITGEDIDEEIQEVFQHNTSQIPVKESDLIIATRSDKELQKVIHFIQHGWPTKSDDTEISAYFTRKAELSTVNNCVLSGDRIIIPKSLRGKILQQLHKGHPGIQRMKALARSYVYWPKMDSDIEEFVKECYPCAEAAKTPIKTPLHSWPKADKPWSRVHVDFAGPIDGYWYLILVDAFSKWPEVFKTTSITAQTTIALLSKLFSSYGPPEILVTDNGTQFTAIEFATYCENLGITHLRSPAYHPQSNGQAERFVDTFKRSLKKLKGKGTDMAVQEILYTYRYTPATALTENKSPAEAFLGRKIRTPFTLLQHRSPDNGLRDTAMESQFNRRHGVTERIFRNGDTVWVYSKPGIPPRPGIVTRKVNDVIFDVQVDTMSWRRHRNQLAVRKERTTSTNQPTTSSATTPRASTRIRQRPFRYRD